MARDTELLRAATDNDTAKLLVRKPWPFRAVSFAAVASPNQCLSQRTAVVLIGLVYVRVAGLLCRPHSRTLPLFLSIFSLFLFVFVLLLSSVSVSLCCCCLPLSSFLSHSATLSPFSLPFSFLSFPFSRSLLFFYFLLFSLRFLS